ncbi:MAG: response regulator [Variovorax sp.]|nr:MAG: response regulator [Variovorax sp.]
MTTSCLRTVAVLDDDADLTASIVANLRRMNLRAFEFTNGQTLAIESRARAFDAYVLDWLLDDVTAITLIEDLRSQPSSARAPIFLLSGNLAVGGVPSDAALFDAIERHQLIYRAKPYSTVKLAKDLHDCLTGGDHEKR